MIATSPVSGSISTSQMAVPLGKTGSCISLSVTTASPSLSSSGSVQAAPLRAASSNKSKVRLVSREPKRPSSNDDVLRRRVQHDGGDAPCLWRSDSTAALENTVAAWRIERPECEPPPTLHHVGVAEDDVARVSTGTCSRSATTCAKLVSWPCPLGCVPMTTSTRPSGRTLIARLLARRADRGFDIVGEPKAEQLAARLGLAAARGKAAPIGDLHRPVHVRFVVAAVVEHADGVAVRHRLGADEVLAPQRDAVEAELLGAPRRPAARSRKSLPAGPSCDRPWSASCW